MKETLKISDRFNLAKKLGQGTFSYIYEAYDKVLKKNVALKIEKKDKNKSILIFEYNVLKTLAGVSHVCNAYDFVKNSEQNLIVMDLLGNNLAKVRKCLEENYNYKIAIQLLIEMLDAIEEVHDKGFIHRDVKASNFVLSRDNRHVYIVDFGLAKKHLDDQKNPVAQRKKADFRGTVSFASLHAHNNIDLSRRDDLWSLYFVILDFLNEKLKWREQKEYTMDEVKAIKAECLNNPEEKLWIATKDIQEVKNIFYHLKSLNYRDKPNYQLVKDNLKSILSKNLDIPQSIAATHIYGNIGQHKVNNTNSSLPVLINQTSNQVFNSFYVTKGMDGVHQRQEFQTPDKPNPNLQKAQMINKTLYSQCVGSALVHQDQTPQSNHGGHCDDQAFPKASPHHLQNSRITQKDQNPHVIKISTQQSKQEKKPKKAKNEKITKQKNETKKRESKRQTKVKVKQDEEPVKFDELLQQVQADIMGKKETRMSGMTIGNSGVYNFQPNNANCVNQHINISQNIFLSPQFLLLLNDKNENPIFQTGTNMPPLSSQYSVTTAAQGQSKPSTNTITIQNPAFQPQDSQILTSAAAAASLLPLSISTSTSKIELKQPSPLQPSPSLISLKEPLHIQPTKQISMSQSTTTRGRRKAANDKLYQIEPKKPKPIFRVEKVIQLK